MKIETRLKRQNRINHTEGSEKGLYYEKEIVGEVIKSKEARGEDCKFEKSLLRSWRKYTEADYSSVRDVSL